MKLSKLLSAIKPEKIKTAEDFDRIIKAKHVPEKFLGMTIPYKFKVNQDVFEAATKGQMELTLPENSHIKLNGIGNSNMKLVVGEGAVFKAPNAMFRNVRSKGKNLILEIITGDLYTWSKAKSKVGTVFGEAVSADKSVQRNKAVVKNAYAFGDSKQTNINVFGKAEAGGTAEQTNKYVKGNVTSRDKSIQRNVMVEGDATSDGLSRQANEHVKGSAISETSSEQINGLVEKDALSLHKSSQTNQVVLGKAESAWYSEQRNLKTHSEAVRGVDSIQDNNY